MAISQNTKLIIVAYITCVTRRVCLSFRSQSENKLPAPQMLRGRMKFVLFCVTCLVGVNPCRTHRNSRVKAFWVPLLVSKNEVWNYLNYVSLCEQKTTNGLTFWASSAAVSLSTPCHHRCWAEPEGQGKTVSSHNALLCRGVTHSTCRVLKTSLNQEGNGMSPVGASFKGLPGTKMLHEWRACTAKQQFVTEKL